MPLSTHQMPMANGSASVEGETRQPANREFHRQSVCPSPDTAASQWPQGNHPGGNTTITLFALEEHVPHQQVGLQANPQ